MYSGGLRYDVIQGLWIGPALSAMERLSLASFLACGHEVHLHTYGAVDGVPSGVVLRDAAEILPASAIFHYREHATSAGFANFFRYKLLLERGGWWVDLDVVCLAPFDFPGEHVFAGEPAGEGRMATNAVIKAPAGSAAMARAWEVCRSKDPRALGWGETGPRLLTALVSELALEHAIQPPEVFCPLHYDRWDDALDPAFVADFGPATRAVHLWNEMWRREGRSKDERYPPGCLYERLKARYLPNSSNAAAHSSRK